MSTTSPTTPPRILIIGAGSRGTAYARAITDSTAGIVAAVAEPDAFKRRAFGEAFVWGRDAQPLPGQEFLGWQDFVARERARRDAAAGEGKVEGGDEGEGLGVDAAVVCTLDETHRAVVEALAGLPGPALHVLCEKPLATRLRDCVEMVDAVMEGGSEEGQQGKRQRAILGICHVLRYSPHNMLLRELVRGPQEVVGEVVSVEHTEPVGWWHFAHSYVR